jgi:hypothetical protein
VRSAEDEGEFLVGSFVILEVLAGGGGAPPDNASALAGEELDGLQSRRGEPHFASPACDVLAARQVHLAPLELASFRNGEAGLEEGEERPQAGAGALTRYQVKLHFWKAGRLPARAGFLEGVTWVLMPAR